jgi:hypothetical protein
MNPRVRRFAAAAVDDPVAAPSGAAHPQTLPPIFLENLA